MKTIGLIGGMSWESTVPYYRAINERVKERLGGLHSARLILYSVDFAEIEHLQSAGNWDAAGAILGDVARSLKLAGADFAVLCTNTMHKVASDIEECGLPLLHIADPTAKAAQDAGHGCVALLGTRFTMEQDFYRTRLESQGLKVLTPSAEDREIVHRVIYDELCLGQTKPQSRTQYVRIIEQLAGAGAEAIILGCTEISLLIGPGDTGVPLIDTTALHARAAADHALDAA
jgi:aspartate racemase